MTRWVAIAGLLWLACPAPAAAHRLDEYLQATRISLARDVVDLEIDLTPGADVASRVFSLIDTDGDGQLSIAERDAYATSVVASATLDVDGRLAPLALVRSTFPSFDDMRGGVGTIHLTARARPVAGSSGRHQLHYINIHHAEMSAYLVNALMPPHDIRITDQQRDAFQHELRLDYVVGASAGGRPLGALVIAYFLLAIGLGYWGLVRVVAAGLQPGA